MISCIKNNPIKSVLAIFLTAILSLNYLGFCFGQNRFLSNEEKRDLVIEYVIKGEKANLEYFRHVKAMAKSDKYRLYAEQNLGNEPIPYRDIEEFLALNPNCCQVTLNYITTGYEANPISCWERLTGWSAIVGIRYVSRYRDNKGIAQVKKIEIFPSISNCGELIWELV